MPQKMSFFTVMMYTLTGGRAYRGTADSSMGFLKLTTTGRKSGKERTVQLMYLRDGSAYVISASNAGRERKPGWYYNLRSNPQVSMQAHNTRLSAVAEIADPEKRKELWTWLVEMAPMYAGYEKRTPREIPMVILRPIPSPEEQKAE